MWLRRRFTSATRVLPNSAVNTTVCSVRHRYGHHHAASHVSRRGSIERARPIPFWDWGRNEATGPVRRDMRSGKERFGLRRQRGNRKNGWRGFPSAVFCMGPGTKGSGKLAHDVFHPQLQKPPLGTVPSGVIVLMKSGRYPAIWLLSSPGGRFFRQGWRAGRFPAPP